MDRGYGIFDTGTTGWAISKSPSDKLTKDVSGPCILDPGGRKLLSHGGDTEASLLGVGPHIATAGSLANSHFNWDARRSPGKDDTTQRLISFSWARVHKIGLGF